MATPKTLAAPASPLTPKKPKATDSVFDLEAKRHQAVSMWVAAAKRAGAAAASTGPSATAAEPAPPTLDAMGSWFDSFRSLPSACMDTLERVLPNAAEVKAVEQALKSADTSEALKAGDVDRFFTVVMESEHRLEKARALCLQHKFPDQVEALEV